MEEVKTRNTFIFYRSFKESLAGLNDADKLAMYEAITDYALDMKEPTLTGVGQSLFTLMRPVLEANLKRWRNGCKGGCPQGAEKPSMYGNINATKTQPKQNQNKTETKPNKDKDVNKDKNYNENKDCSYMAQTTRFVPPTLEEVKAYVKEKGYTFNVHDFCDFYSSKGWMVGTSKMTDWKSSARRWQRRNQSQAQPQRASDIGVVLHEKTKFSTNDCWD